MRAKYTLLNGSNIRQTWNGGLFGQPLMLAALCLLNILIGYGLRSFLVPATSPTTGNGDASLRFSSVEKTFTYRKDLADHPTNASDYEWAHLFPAQGGYFKHPTISPERGTFSGFHQLHCLNGIRKGYWRLYDIAKDGKPEQVDELPLMQSPAHVRHCIDLIRQSLMCQPDLTVEIKDDALGGVHGFGTQHTCVNWDELIAWLGKWENYGSEE